MPSRRHALRAGGLVAAALAGCLGSSETPGTTTEDATTDGTTTGTTTDSTTTSNATDALRWTVETGGELGTPVVADGTVYAPGRALHAVAPDGTERWRFQAAVPVQSRPLVRDGGVYVVTGSLQGSPAGEEFAAHALAPDGSERWSHPAGHGMVSVLDATADAAFVGTHDDYLQKRGESLSALDARDGDQRWTVEFGDASGGVLADGTVIASYWSGVAGVDPEEGVVRWRSSAESLGGVAGDTVVVVGRADVRALAVADGAERWAVTPSGSPTSATAIDGSVYVGDYEGTLHAFDAESGEERWSASVGGSGYATPAVTEDSVYAGGDALHALDPDTGEERWQRGGGDVAGLAATPTGVYVSRGRSLRALGPDGSERWLYETDGRPTRPVVGADAVYVGDRSGTLAALRP